MSRITAAERKLLIQEYYARFHKPEFLIWDPLLVVHQFNGLDQQEYVALIAALLALGGVKQIIASAKNWVKRLNLPSEDLMQMEESELLMRAKGFRHRFYIDRDLVLLTLLYQKSVKQYGSLAKHFLNHHQSGNETIEQALSGLIADYKNWAAESGFNPGPHFYHLLNSPEQGSTCKRWLMYLKWMIRPADGIDLELWKYPELRPEQLLIPLDTHLFKISKRLGLTTKKTANFKASLEVTRNLKKINSVDPTAYDFSLCRFGMLDYRKMLADR